MAPKAELADRFDVSGPMHMLAAGSSIDWDKEEHRRCIAACMMKAAYVLENDRTLCRMGSKVLAPPWSESFHFQLADVLTDDSFKHGSDKFTYGAIYEHAGAPPRHPSAPQYIVAFRGTMLLHPKAMHDMFLDAKVLVNTLSDSKRSKYARLAVKELLSTIEKGKLAAAYASASDNNSNSCVVWLTGHSLGASLALDVGRAMMPGYEGRNLPTFLFNPPMVFLSPLVNKLLPSELVRSYLQDTNNCVKVGFGWLVTPHQKRMDELFQQLAPWAPNLYVHDKDVICRGYIDYFHQRQLVDESFHGLAASSAVKLSYRDMLFWFLSSKEKELPHLLPSATLWRNSWMDKEVNWFHRRLDAHGLHHWWKPDAQLQLTDTRYRY